MPKRIAVESDGDRKPKDVYLIDADTGERVATIEGHEENQMFHFAQELVRCWNQQRKETKP